MKELYIAPELEILGFMAEERLANGEDPGETLDFDSLVSNNTPVVFDEKTDIDLGWGW